MIISAISRADRFEAVNRCRKAEKNISENECKKLDDLAEATRDYEICDKPIPYSRGSSKIEEIRNGQIKDCKAKTEKFINALKAYNTMPSAFVYHLAVENLEINPIYRIDVPLRNQVSNLAKTVGEKAPGVKKEDILNDWDLLNEVKVVEKKSTWG